MIKKVTFFLAFIALVLAVGYGYVTRTIDQYIAQPLQLEQQEIYTLESGMSFHHLLADLTQKQLIEANSLSKLVGYFYPQLTQVKAGTYLLTPELNLNQTLALFKTGKEHQFAITFVEGSTFAEWREALQNSPYLEHTIDGMSEQKIAKNLGLEYDRLEGLFLAETYHYTMGTSDLDILARAAKKLKNIIDEQWQQRQDNLPLKNHYDALILASIIEKETAVETERSRISSVFVNRLNKRMRLQTDPTVIYGMGEEYDGNIRKKDLRTPTPYNTYVIFGLPPTPIAMPGEASIVAALNPEQSRYLYFVASGTGGHVFSKSLNEHNRAVRAYLKKLRSSQ
ncbi:endolytic transglycosylase MltG [Vibrio ostreicida]|uniref:Endolytic murein transglycosylase n=1 Tax=Vibrio ostreicida TaxID=526588 RepID=A0ABT8BVM8_9VIBR|nr:endolytic transglycosylase MltG [Vibrio ostreicida]MDN3610504.1 endolytic transglycosylase MltG [Vibrio ostreicida]NPD07494.1 endolytic transglycosylase MltG [Vibrio ostreicida]